MESYRPETIRRASFNKVLARYDATISELSRRARAKPSDNEESSSLKTLAQLDRWRLEDLPRTLQQRRTVEEETTGGAWLEKDEVQNLIRWKLKHGTFRPRMIQLVASNADDEVKKITRDAFAVHATGDADRYVEPMTILCSLKGIGPASASLLLSVYDPVRVPFFSDEAYRWLMYAKGTGHGWDRVVRYNHPTYHIYYEKVREIRERLKDDDADGPWARDVERVGFVLGKARQQMEINAEAKSDGPSTLALTERTQNPIETRASRKRSAEQATKESTTIKKSKR